MKLDLRVVRGPDWIQEYGNQDGGEGHVGSVVEIAGQNNSSLPEKCVTVQWDIGTRHQYRVGSNDAYDLYVFDNASTGVSHSVVCDQCKSVGIPGFLWKCTNCQGYDLCSSCYMSDMHDVTHIFQRFNTRSSEGVNVPARKESEDQKIKAMGLFKEAIVTRGPDWTWGNQDGGEENQGKIFKVNEISKTNLVFVEWSNGQKADYRVGCDGKVDLKCSVPSIGGFYYKNHLPVLGKSVVTDSNRKPESFMEFMHELSSTMLSGLLGDLKASASCQSIIHKGYRVVRGPDWKWQDQDGGDGYVGTIKSLKTGKSLCVKIIWDSGKENVYRAGVENAYDLLVFDSSPAGINHSSFKCDECGEDPIFGTRWKCSECSDFDLCSTCYHSDKHDTSHSFLRIDKDYARPFPVTKRCESTTTKVYGVFPGALVKRGKHWKWGNVDGGDGGEGKVSKISKWTPETRRSRADVHWQVLISRPTAHRFGHKGKVDLKYTKPETGGYYYKSHLPILGKKEKVAQKFKVGDKVNIIMDADIVRKMQEDHGGWNDGMIKYLKKVGTIVKTDDYGVVIIKYDDDKKIVYNQDVLNLIWINAETEEKAIAEPLPSKEPIASSVCTEIVADSTELKLAQPLCKICLSSDACVAFVPCGHLVSCPKCAEGLDKCPICRSDIKHWLRTYIQ